MRIQCALSAFTWAKKEANSSELQAGLVTWSSSKQCQTHALQLTLNLKLARQNVHELFFISQGAITLESLKFTREETIESISYNGRYSEKNYLHLSFSIHEQCSNGNDPLCKVFLVFHFSYKRPGTRNRASGHLENCNAISGYAHAIHFQSIHIAKWIRFNVHWIRFAYDHSPCERSDVHRMRIQFAKTGPCEQALSHTYLWYQLLSSCTSRMSCKQNIDYSGCNLL